MQQPVADENSTAAAAAGMEPADGSGAPSTIVNTPVTTNVSSDVYGGRDIGIFLGEHIRQVNMATYRVRFLRPGHAGTSQGSFPTESFAGSKRDQDVHRVARGIDGSLHQRC